MDKYQEIKEAFEQLRDEDNAKKMSSYMRDKFKYYGIPTPKRKAVYKSIFNKEKKAGAVDWGFLEKCWNDEYRPASCRFSMNIPPSGIIHTVAKYFIPLMV